MKVRSSVKPICEMQNHQKKRQYQSNLRESEAQAAPGLISANCDSCGKFFCAAALTDKRQ